VCVHIEGEERERERERNNSFIARKGGGISDDSQIKILARLTRKRLVLREVTATAVRQNSIISNLDINNSDNL